MIKGPFSQEFRESGGVENPFLSTRGSTRGDGATGERFSEVPEELRRLEQWVCWRWNGAKKEPVHPVSGRPVPVNDRGRWCSFEGACGALEEKLFDGIGFVFTRNDPYVGVDLDGCIDPRTGEVDPWALEIVRRLNSYTEISPSGTGLHIITKTQNPRSSRRKKGLEIYASGRFFTVTGRIFSV